MSTVMDEKLLPGPALRMRPACTVLAVLLLLQMLLFYPTYWSMVEIWWRSETFAHGFFIFPISAFLIWKKRHHLAAALPKTDYRALLPLAGLVILWLVAYAVDVNAVKQFAVVLMLPTLVWLVLGWRMTSIILFPLAFLAFAVPFGEFLIYPLMEFTAVFTVHAIRAVGIPVFWEGLYFSLPSGSWSVVEACSGFRYILASLTLGALYAYLSYHSIWRRLAFMLLALIVPIIANGIRAFMIVMIGHYSGMELAVGVDHLIYGWVWFGVVMFVMFWIGSYWTDKSAQEKPHSPVTAPAQAVNANEGAGSIWALVLAGVILAAPVALVLGQHDDTSAIETLQVPNLAAEWELTADQNITEWQPIYQGATQEISAVYRSGSEEAGLHVAYFAAQQQGQELVNRGHRLIHMKDKFWKELSRETRIEQVAGADVGLIEAQIKSPEQSLLVWQWKYFNGVRTSNDFYLKALEAWAKIAGKPQQGAAVILYAAYDGDSKEGLTNARRRLHGFAADLIPQLERQFTVRH